MARIVLKGRYSGNYVLTGLRTENAPTMVGGRVTCPYCAAEHVWIAATDDNDRANHKPSKPIVRLASYRGSRMSGSPIRTRAPSRILSPREKPSGANTMIVEPCSNHPIS